jgi:hypothetical protein
MKWAKLLPSFQKRYFLRGISAGTLKKVEFNENGKLDAYNLHLART